ncbi:AAA family ATPase [Pectobacterium brasiliense]|uniref:AAA family ATPase n=1 Tax=Pectobacterium aroidearum TaxID=1201031 RepID=A0AAW3T3D6_9GAMM|nr:MULTISPECIES: AAA family ATPase [Pectobacterium]AZK61211.1 AAA family ATPase [Pectobacterium versatile]MBA5206408.1 AAA family ATPase [Pectobacterium aroidearum]MBN3174383.1 AAA family ATPase [Pectobacterium brasiliense]POY59330.1 ATP-binding protein [Pectobacterium versatile]POY63566.1 ATP-binding protein [Pectobacterium versatile]
MKLTGLKIHKLFGLLDYEIPLDQSEITMLTGPNGYGKTMILKIINSILSNELNILCKLNFEYITLNYQGGSISIRCNSAQTTLQLEHFGSEGELLDTEILILEIEEGNPDEMIVFYLKSEKTRHKQKKLKEKPLRSDYLNKIISEDIVSFIQADRLKAIKGDITIIDMCASKLKNLMEMAQDESATLSQKLDANFPIRLFERLEQQKKFSSENIQARLKGVQDKRRRYMHYGLIHSEDDLMPEKSTSLNSSNEYLGVLDLYIEDALVKLSPFEVLYQKIDLFESILKEKILAFKTVVIDRDSGVYFRSLNDDIIDRNMLSSGEQNQIVLLFNLIFDLASQKVILVDEPEISLHVAWQQTFLDSLKKIQKINKYEKVIIATHSPQVISKNWALTFDLYEMLKHKDQSIHSKGNE